MNPAAPYYQQNQYAWNQYGVGNAAPAPPAEPQPPVPVDERPPLPPEPPPPESVCLCANRDFYLVMNEIIGVIVITVFVNFISKICYSNAYAG